MSTQLAERIAQFRKMAQDDPDNELGHFRLGQLLMEDNNYEDAARSRWYAPVLGIWPDGRAFGFLGCGEVGHRQLLPW